LAPWLEKAEVPVRYSEFDDELAEREALIEFNRQREKTPAQIVNEFEEMLAVERERGKENQGERTDLSQNSEKGGESHDSWEEASESFDLSKDTLSKGKTVKDKAESDDEPEEVREAAREAWDGLQSRARCRSTTSCAAPTSRPRRASSPRSASRSVTSATPTRRRPVRTSRPRCSRNSEVGS
jgi:hypothetical protein